MEKSIRFKILEKIIIFTAIGIVFWLLTPNGGYSLYLILILLGAFALVYHYNKKKNIPRKAFTLGIFLVVFDFIVENSGAILGYWNTYGSRFFVGAVPIEIMILILFGGTAWAMHLPKKFNKIFLFGESTVFGFYGALGEYLLILNGLMIYKGGWTFIHAFFGYFFTWIILFLVWYKIINKK